MVGRNRIAKDTQSTRACYAGRCSFGRHRKVGKERWFGDVGRFWPVVDLTFSNALYAFPQLAGCTFDVGIIVFEGFCIHRKFHQLTDLLASRPDIAEVHVAHFAIGTFTSADRLRHQIDIHISGNGIGHYQRWRCQEIRLDVRMNARLKVAITRQYGGGNDIVFGDNFVHRRR